MKNTITAILLAFIILTLNGCSNNERDSISKFIPVEIDGKFGYINQDGNFEVNPQFKDAFIFSEGLAAVQSDEDSTKIGYIGEDGLFKIEPQYIGTTPFIEGIAWVVKESSVLEAINSEGKVLFTLKDAERAFNYAEGLARYTIINNEGVELFGFINKEGTTIIIPQFSEADNFCEGLAAVKNSKNKWGYINKEGKIVINYQFDYAGYFNNKIAVVKTGSKFGLINKKGNFILIPKYEDIQIEPNGKMLVKQKGKFGWVDKDDEIIINPQFEDARLFLDNDLAPVKTGNQFGYINKKAKFIIQPQYQYASPFINKRAIVKQNNKFGIINTDGKFIVKPTYKNIHEVAIWQFEGSGVTHNIRTDYHDLSNLITLINENISDKSLFGIEPYSEDIKKYGPDSLSIEDVLKIYPQVSNDFIRTHTLQYYFKIPKPKLNKYSELYLLCLKPNVYKISKIIGTPPVTLIIKCQFDADAFRIIKEVNNHLEKLKGDLEINAKLNNNSYFSGDHYDISVKHMIYGIKISIWLKNTYSADLERTFFQNDLIKYQSQTYENKYEVNEFGDTIAIY